MNRIVIFLFFVLLSFTGYSQKFYLKPFVGYAFGIQGNYYYAKDANYEYNYYDSSFWQLNKLYKIKPATGFKYGLATGTQIFKNVLFEVGFEFLSGKPQNFEESDNYYLYNEATIYINYYYSVTGKYFMVKPAFIFHGDKKIFRPYLKLGGNFGSVTMKEEMEMRIVNTHPQFYPFESYTMEFKYDKRVSTGLFVSTGFEFYLFDNVYFTFEVSYDNINYIPLKGEYTKYEYRGSDILDDMEDNERYVEFVDEYDSGYEGNSDNPAKVLKQKYTFNHISVLGGIKISLAP